MPQLSPENQQLLAQMRARLGRSDSPTHEAVTPATVTRTRAVRVGRGMVTVSSLDDGRARLVCWDADSDVRAAADLAPSEIESVIAELRSALTQPSLFGDVVDDERSTG